MAPVSLSFTGSSPHAWGTLDDHLGDIGNDRFIPTRVGNTSAVSCARAASAVHPHTRGEHICAGISRSFACGSSPHAWGTRHARVMSAAAFRFIPTRVGNTLKVNLWTEAQWRFIPTRVGNTPLCKRLHVQPPVHPHTRGEHLIRIEHSNLQAGSSPHAWGTLPDRGPNPASRRFIPTRVGNTASPGRRRRICPVHPHTRGEHLHHMHRKAFYLGSSPHAWGTLIFPSARVRCQRFIPTRVGNT